MTSYVLALDQGTTSTRAFVLAAHADVAWQVIGSHQLPVTAYFPENGWVEQEGEALWQTTLACCRQALAAANLAATQLLAMAITNQRETTLVWDRKNHQVLGRAIVWQDRRTSEVCQRLRQQGLESEIQHKTGLLLDPYFSATKIAWILDQHDPDRRRARAGELAFGTVDSFLVWRLTQGRSHITDATNASRTLLFNLQTQQWDDALLSLFNIPREILPTVVDSCGHLAKANWGDGEVIVTAILGDQQAALIGQACLQPGMAKCTYGTGAFLMQNIGVQPICSQQRLLTTVAYRWQNQPVYAMEGSIFMAGATMQWLREGLGLLEKESDSAALVSDVDKLQSLYLVPAFTGLGAPYWDAEARGALLGLTRDTSREAVVAAGLQAVCYQTLDLLKAIQAEGLTQVQTLRVDGGMARNEWMVQFLADVMQSPVERPLSIESTVMGVAYFAALGCGLFSSLEQITQQWQLAERFLPGLTQQQARQIYHGWQVAVGRVRTV